MIALRVISSVASIVALAACAGPSRAMPTPVEPPVDFDPPPIADPLLPALAFGPVAARAVAYNDDVEPQRHDELGDELFAAFVDHQPHAAITDDPRLEAACDQLAELVHRGGALDPAVVDFALRERGVIEHVHGFAIAQVGTPAEVAAQLSTRFGDPLVGELRVGIGGADPIVALVVDTPVVEIADLPRVVPAHGTVDLVGTLDERLHAPRVTITHDDGSVETPSLALGGDGVFRVPFSCGDRVGPQWIAIEGCDASNTRLRLALFPVSCAVALAPTFRTEPAANVAGLHEVPELERRVTSIINRERADAGVALLSTHPTIAAIARAKAARVARAVGTPSARAPIANGANGANGASLLAAARLQPPVVHEVMFRAADLAAVAETLLNDVAFRATIAGAGDTHVGVGIAADKNHELVVDILIVQIPVVADVDAIARDIAASIHAAAGVAHDDLLGTAATEYARELAAGREPSPTLLARIDNIRQLLKLSTLVVSVQSMPMPNGFTVQPELARSFADFAVGVAQSARHGPRGGRIYVVVLYALYRRK